MDLSATELAALAFWAYVVIFGVAAGDAVFPVLPGETTVILGGVLAAQGDLSVLAVGVVGALGAVVGDNASYQIGRTANRRGRTPDQMKGRFGRLLEWAEAALESRGPSVLVLGRFIPGGRTALTFGAGHVGYRRRRFVAATVLAGIVWSTYATAIGYLGGEVFEETWWAGLLLGLAVSFAVTAVIEAVRKARGGGMTVAETRAHLQRSREEARLRAAPEAAAGEGED